MRLNDGVCSEWFAVEQDIHSSLVRAGIPHIQHLDRGGYKCGLHAFQGRQRHHGRFVWCTFNIKRTEATAGKPGLATSLWDMVYANDAGAVSQSPEQLIKMMDMMVVVCAAFGFTVSEAATEIICLSTKGTPESTAFFSVEAAAQVYHQTNEFVYLGAGSIHYNGDLSIMVDRRIRNASCYSFRRYTLKPFDRPNAPLELKIRMQRANVLETMLFGCVTWSPCACHYDMLRRALHIVLLTRFIGWRKKTRTSSYTPNFSPVHLVCINRLAQQRLAPAFAATSSRSTMHTPIKRALAGLLTIVD